MNVRSSTPRDVRLVAKDWWRRSTLTQDSFYACFRVAIELQEEGRRDWTKHPPRCK